MGLALGRSTATTATLPCFENLISGSKILEAIIGPTTDTKIRFALLS